MIGRGTLRAITVGSGLAVASNDYAQPLPAGGVSHFGASNRRMGTVAMLSQVGYAAGLLLFVPPGDRLERRSFVLVMLGAAYPALLRSIGGLLRDEPVLAAVVPFGAMSFGAFSAFWTTLAFHLAGPPFGYPSGVVGLFGLVGIVGALAPRWRGGPPTAGAPGGRSGRAWPASCSPTPCSTGPAGPCGAWWRASSCSTWGRSRPTSPTSPGSTPSGPRPAAG